jgi:hypothetical protein
MVLDGDWDAHCEAVYQCFERDLRSASFFGLRVSRRKAPEVKGKPDGFWHVISERVDRESEDRTPDLRRCERIPWIGPMISASGTDRVLCWEQERPSSKGGKSVVVSLPGFEFVVILRPHPNKGYALLVTAFCPSGRKREKMRREYEIIGPFML